MPDQITKQNEYWPRNSDGTHLYHVNNDILADCIGIGSGSICRPDRVSGFNYGKGLGYALLTYFVSQALNFRRLPFYEDRIYCKYIQKRRHQSDREINNISQDDIDAIVEEIRAIYEHTQEHLKEASLATVKVRREVASNETGYAETIMKLKECAEVLGQKTIQFDMDTLNSFGDEGAYKHLADVTIEHEFPASDVLYCSNLIETEGSRDLMETGEWVIINRSPTGLVEFPVASIKCDTANWASRNVMSTDSAKKFYKNHTPLEYRNITYLESFYGTYGKRMSIRKKLGRWLASNNELA